VNEPLREKISDLYDIKSLYADYNEMLEKEDLDLAFAGAENYRHADIVEAAAARGVHIALEKPMAATYDQAKRMVAAAEKHDIKLMINWPTAWSPAIQHAYDLAKAGRIGHIYQVRYHAAHQGPREIGCSKYFWEWLYDEEKNGAGAFMDYCCYGADISCWILGKAKNVVAMGGRLVKDYDIIDDNAILLAMFDKAMGVCEASWTQIGHEPYGLLIAGSEGTMVIPEPGKVKLITADNIEGEIITAPAFPKGRSNGPEYFISCLDKDKPVEGPCSPYISKDAQEVLQAGLDSIKTGKRIDLPLD